MTEHLSGGDMLIRALQDEGVDYIFGYPGGAALHIYDAIFRQQRVEHILVRHEQAATHMADGYARATGRPGVVLVTSGPGATNAITGIATAYMDSIPMVVISGQVPTRPDRHRCVPGNRHGRRFAAGGETQLPRQKRSRHSDGGEKGVLHCNVGPTRSGRDRRAEGRHGPGDDGAVQVSEVGFAALLQSSHCADTPGRFAAQSKRSRARSVPIIYAGGGVVQGKQRS